MSATFEDLRVLKSAEEIVDGYVNQLTELARQLNSFASGLKTVRNQEAKQSKTIRDMVAEYQVKVPENSSDMLFDDDDINWLKS